jgi:hypothetical protein
VLAVGGGGPGLQRVRSLSGCKQPRFDEPPLPCRIELLGVPAPQTLAWLAEATGFEPKPRDVTLTEVNSNGDAVTLLEIGDARISRIALTDLDAASSTPASVVIDVTGDLVREPGIGKATLPLAPTPLTSNAFKVTVDATTFTRITDVEDVVVDLTGPEPQLALRLTTALSAGGGDLLRDWAADAQGGDPRSFTVELLNPGLTGTLLTLSGTNGGPIGYPEPFGVGTAGLQRVSVDVVSGYGGLT